MIKLKPFNVLHWVYFLLSTVISLYLFSQPATNVMADWPGVVQFVRSALLMFALYLMFQKLFEMELHTKIILGMILGGFAGFIYGNEIVEVKPVGTAFIRLIQMIVVPLVLASLISGTASLGDIKKMKRIGSKTLVYYLCSTAVAISIGLIFANIFQPGSGMSPDVQAKLLESYGGAAGEKVAAAQGSVSIVDTFLNMIPKNPVEALASASMLQVIFFSIMTGIALTILPKDKAQPVINFFDGLFEAMIKIVVIVIEIAPYGVFALIADAVGSFGLEILASLLKYTLVTAVALFAVLMIYPFVVKLFSGMSPRMFMRGIRPAQLVAFSTSSSGATLPVTMECSEDNLGVSKEVASFILPLGATINMDGTALYQGVATIFIAQVYGIPLDLGAQLMVVLTATLASIGTAAAPGVGILMLVIVLQQVGVPLEGIALILAVDRLLDMLRTVVNITSDATASVIVAATEGQLHEPPNESKGV